MELRKLHLGCGTKRLPGFLHIDNRKEVKPDIVGDVCNLPMIETDSVETIYACHVLEHLYSDQVVEAFREWSRVLASGGILLLAVPDVGEACHLYCGGVTLERLSGLFWGGQRWEGNVHYTGWDFERLANALRVAGFYSIKPWDPNSCAYFPAGYDDFSFAVMYDEDGGGPYSVSLNVMGVAP